VTEPLALLLGTWRGRGHEQYPTVEEADYEEEIVFEDSGKGFLLYAQRAWTVGRERILHAEAGFWRLGEGGGVEVTLAHPLGLVEVSEGTVVDGRFALASTHVGRTASGEPVAAVARRYEVAGDILRYEIDMALDHVPLALHLAATLHRL
jgi:hypothetical protein